MVTERFIPDIWSAQLVRTLERSSLLAGMFPPAPPMTRRQRVKARIKARVRRTRMALASRLAGFDVETGCEW